MRGNRMDFNQIAESITRAAATSAKAGYEAGYEQGLRRALEAVRNIPDAAQAIAALSLKVAA